MTCVVSKCHHPIQNKKTWKMLPSIDTIVPKKKGIIFTYKTKKELISCPTPCIFVFTMRYAFA